MTIPRIVRDAARALVSVATEEGSVPRVIDDLLLLEDVWSLRRDLFMALGDRAIPLSERRTALKKSFDTKIQPCLVNALLILQDADALHAFETFAADVRRVAEEKASHVVVTVSSAVPLEEKQRAALEERIAASVKGSCSLRMAVDPHVLGGLALAIGDMRIDATLRGSIERLTQTLSS